MKNELTHWGIKGQKWGVRRYENEDGTLTEAGKIRYGKKRFAEDNDEFQSHNLDPREVVANSDKMTDRQLQAAFNRLNTQSNISKMVPLTGKEKVVKAGREWVSKSVIGAVGGALGAMLVKEIVNAIKNPSKVAEKYQKLARSAKIGFKYLAPTSTARDIFQQNL